METVSLQPKTTDTRLTRQSIVDSAYRPVRRWLAVGVLVVWTYVDSGPLVPRWGWHTRRKSHRPCGSEGVWCL